MTGRTDDQALIDACRAGETAAYGLLVRRYQDRLYPTLFRLTGRAEDAQDLLQEAFLRGYQNLGPGFTGKARSTRGSTGSP